MNELLIMQHYGNLIYKSRGDVEGITFHFIGFVPYRFSNGHKYAFKRKKRGYDCIEKEMIDDQENIKLYYHTNKNKQKVKHI